MTRPRPPWVSAEMLAAESRGANVPRPTSRHVFGLLRERGAMLPQHQAIVTISRSRTYREWLRGAVQVAVDCSPEMIEAAGMNVSPTEVEESARRELRAAAAGDAHGQ